MKQINQLALQMKQNEEGTEAYESAFTDIYTVMFPKVHRKALHLVATTKNANIDENDLISKTLYEGVMKSVKHWKEDGVAFDTYLLFIMDGIHLDEVKRMQTDKRGVLSTALDMDAPNEDGSLFHEFIEDKSLRFEHMLDESPAHIIVDAYEYETGETEATVINTLMEYVGDRKECSLALARVYNAEEYTPTLRKRVSRIKKQFKEFIMRHDLKKFL